MGPASPTAELGPAHPSPVLSGNPSGCVVCPFLAVKKRNGEGLCSFASFQTFLVQEKQPQQNQPSRILVPCGVHHTQILTPGTLHTTSVLAWLSAGPSLPANPPTRTGQGSGLHLPFLKFEV